MFIAGFIVLLMFAAEPAGAYEPVREGEFHGQPVLILANGKIELSVLPNGGSLARLVLQDDSEQMNPLWDAVRAGAEAGRTPRPGGAMGHFICVDGFGPVSDEERAAGLSGHGEAHTQSWVTQSFGVEDKVASLTQAVQLPHVHEVYTRTIRMVEGENVVYVQGKLQSLLGFDRPVCWAEHATIGSPFLEAGVTVVDISENRAVTRPHESKNATYRLPPFQEFAWPLLTTADGEEIDLRAAPNPPNSMEDHTAHRLDPQRQYAFVTALHPEKRLLLGYLFPTEQYPWLQIWEHYPPTGIMARGLEFGSQAFDLPRRTVVTQNKLFDQLLYRWLPAQASIEGNFLMFWTRTPEGFQGVDDIQWKDGELRIEDRRSGKSLRLKAALEL
jgi:hypothetical protein